MATSSVYLSLILVLAYLVIVSSCPWEDNRTISQGKCRGDESVGVQPNLLIMDGAYCFNDGTGNCKAFSGRFEYYFNTFNVTYTKHADKSRYVNDDGYHERVPISYDLEGKINYVDKSLNWARQFAKSNREVNQKFNLINMTDFNWCGFVRKNLWPYKSAIKTPDGKYEIYFFNRQSCIYKADGGSSQPQHFNTRFMHNTSLRIDLDANPTIFTMEDNLVGPGPDRIRLIKHKRQHWYESKFKILTDPKPDLKFFMKIDDTICTNCKINSTVAHLLPRSAYYNKSDLCLSDYWQINRNHKNAKLFAAYCGSEMTELSDTTSAKFQSPIEVGLHNMPRGDKESSEGSFFGVDNESDVDWSIFAKDGIVFTAFTTIPTGISTMRVITIYAKFQVKAQDEFDEHYPTPYLADYNATKRGAQWIWKEGRNEQMNKLLNHVDDIAYLHKCRTVLTIFGPLYTETPENSFNADTKSLLGSITELGMWELTSSFFADPESNTLWAYHRLNYIASYEYICAKDSDSIVSAVRKGKYYRRYGSPDMPPSFTGPRSKEYYSEEFLFHKLGLYKGSLLGPEPPDPKLYEESYREPEGPKPDNSTAWVYYLILGVILLVLLMVAICLLTVRRWRKKKRVEAEASKRSANLSNTGASRSARSRSLMTAGPVATTRSRLRRNAPVRSSSRAASSASASRRSVLKK